MTTLPAPIQNAFSPRLEIAIAGSPISLEYARSVILCFTCYDVYHMHLMAGNVIKTLENNIDQLGYIHAADVPGSHEPGTGELNYENILKALNSMGYSGFVGFELSPSESDEKAVEAIKKVLI